MSNWDEEQLDENDNENMVTARNYEIPIQTATREQLLQMLKDKQTHLGAASKKIKTLEATAAKAQASVPGRKRTAKTKPSFKGEDVLGYASHIIKLGKSFGLLHYPLTDRTAFGPKIPFPLALPGEVWKPNPPSPLFGDYLTASLYKHIPAQFHELVNGLPDFADNFVHQLGAQRHTSLNTVKKELPTLLLRKKILTDVHDSKSWHALLRYRDDAPGTKCNRYPPVLYPNGKKSPSRIFMNEALPEMLRCLLYGPASLEDNATHKPASSTLGMLWQLTEVTPGAISLTCVLIIFVSYWAGIKGKPEIFDQVGAVSKIDFREMYMRFRWALESKPEEPLTKYILKFWNQKVFAGIKSVKHVQQVEHSVFIDEEAELEEAMGALDLREGLSFSYDEDEEWPKDNDFEVDEDYEDFDPHSPPRAAQPVPHAQPRMPAPRTQQRAEQPPRTQPRVEQPAPRTQPHAAQSARTQPRIQQLDAQAQPRIEQQQAARVQPRIVHPMPTQLYVEQATGSRPVPVNRPLEDAEEDSEPLSAQICPAGRRVRKIRFIPDNTDYAFDDTDQSGYVEIGDDDEEEEEEEEEYQLEYLEEPPHNNCNATQQLVEEQVEEVAVAWQLVEVEAVVVKAHVVVRLLLPLSHRLQKKKTSKKLGKAEAEAEVVVRARTVVQLPLSLCQQMQKTKKMHLLGEAAEAVVRAPVPLVNAAVGAGVVQAVGPSGARQRLSQKKSSLGSLPVLLTAEDMATPEMWQETPPSCEQPSTRTTPHSLDTYRKLDPITSPVDDLRFLAATESLFLKGVGHLFVYPILPLTPGQAGKLGAAYCLCCGWHIMFDRDLLCDPLVLDYSKGQPTSADSRDAAFLASHVQHLNLTGPMLYDQLHALFAASTGTTNLAL
ncbi:hypothetical protein B0H11DRAFT_2345537 [Mycena galericulata]|nr:hypothetical protein B0H11DRAFT_2345537 [Mycena galericulata]